MRQKDRKRDSWRITYVSSGSEGRPAAWALATGVVVIISVVVVVVVVVIVTGGDSSVVIVIIVVVVMFAAASAPLRSVAALAAFFWAI